MLTLIGIGFVSAFLSSMSGSGAALFATPLLLMSGAGLPVALASNQLCAAVWTPCAAKNYLQGEQLDKRLLVVVAGLGLVGVCIGYAVVASIPIALLRPSIGVVILALVLALLCWNPTGESMPPRMAKRYAVLAGVPLGFYQAIFGSGNTLFSSSLFMALYGFDFKKALAHAYTVAFVWCSASAFLLWSRGWMDFSIAVPTAAGSFAGAFLGSRFGRSLKDESLRRVFLGCGGVMGGWMIFGG